MLQRMVALTFTVLCLMREYLCITKSLLEAPWSPSNEWVVVHLLAPLQCIHKTVNHCSQQLFRTHLVVYELIMRHNLSHYLFHPDK